jgi:peroxiredoxin
MTDTFRDSVPAKDMNPVGLAVASLILGITSIAFSLFLVGGILAIIGSVLGGIHLRKRTTFRTMAIWGISLSIAGLLASVGLGYLYYQGYRQVRAAMNGGEDRNGAALEDWQGVRAPDFSVTSLAGKQIRLTDLRGKRVVVDFWATWCPPCVKEIPHFIRLVDDSDAKDLVVVGISNEEKDRLAKFVKEKGVNYSIASATDLPSPYKDVQSIPTTFFVDRAGVIQTVFQGYHDYEDLKAAALAEDFKGVVKEEVIAKETESQASESIGAEAALKKAKGERERFYALGRAAKESFNNGDYSAAKTYAEELASLTPRYKGDWNYGNAIQDSNVVLGRLALRDGNVAAAKAFLVEAGKSTGSPQMNSFGPNLSLARDLLQKGEREVVIEHLNACKKFWKMDNGRLDDWIALVEGGRIPDFGPNLIY